MSFSLSSFIRRKSIFHGDEYSNGYLGLSFSKPSGWCFLSETELSALPDSQKYLLDDDFIDDLFEEIGLPLVSIASSLTDNETIPQADVWVQLPEDANVGLDVVGEQFETFTQLYGLILKGFEFETFPSESRFCNRNASVCTSRFLYEGTSGRSASVRVKSILMPVDEILLSVNLKAAVDLWNHETDSAFNAFLASFSLADRKRKR